MIYPSAHEDDAGYALKVIVCVKCQSGFSHNDVILSSWKHTYHPWCAIIHFNNNDRCALQRFLALTVPEWVKSFGFREFDEVMFDKETLHSCDDKRMRFLDQRRERTLAHCPGMEHSENFEKFKSSLGGSSAKKRVGPISQGTVNGGIGDTSRQVFTDKDYHLTPTIPLMTTGEKPDALSKNSTSKLPPLTLDTVILEDDDDAHDTDLALNLQEPRSKDVARQPGWGLDNISSDSPAAEDLGPKRAGAFQNACGHDSDDDDFVQLPIRRSKRSYSLVDGSQLLPLSKNFAEELALASADMDTKKSSKGRKTRACNVKTTGVWWSHTFQVDIHSCPLEIAMSPWKVCDTKDKARPFFKEGREDLV